MQFALIKEEIELDPENLGYAGKSDAAIAALLNAPTRPKLNPIPVSDALMFLMKHGLLAKMEGVAIDDPIYSIVRGIQSFIASPMGVVRIDRPEVQFAIAQLVATGFITEAQKSELLGVARTYISRSEELGLGGEVWAAHVAEARRMGEVE